jgi:iron complex outermembrane receptor protein
VYSNSGVKKGKADFYAGDLSFSGAKKEVFTNIFTSMHESETSQFIKRSSNMERNFRNLTWSVGGVFNPGNFRYRANIGTGFRMPGAQELAANGVNYHHFRYEAGDSSLMPETSYQLDLGMEAEFVKWKFQINPFINYFPNYIYLNPSYTYDFLYGAGNQVFNYTQSRVMRFGGEAYLLYRVLPRLTGEAVFEYIYSEQISGEKRGFTLPFSPPATALINLKYLPDDLKFLHKPFLALDFKLSAKQDNIVPPEKKTPGYFTVNLLLGSQIKWKAEKLQINFQVQNLFNTKYFNHTSFYRLIEVPEPGRGYVVNLSMKF